MRICRSNFNEKFVEWKINALYMLHGVDDKIYIAYRLLICEKICYNTIRNNDP